MSNLTLLYGGQETKDPYQDAKFIKGYVTNSRLMGVLVVYINWQIGSDDSAQKNLHQFFYFDQEEFGLDTFKSIETEDASLVAKTEIGLIGGLGAEKMSISEKEAIYLVQSFIQHNLEQRIGLPKDISKCDFFLTRDSYLTDEELELLERKTCIKVSSVCEVINYFIMRLVGKDYEIAKTLSSGVDVSNCLPMSVPGSLLKNTINVDLGNTHEFSCEALVGVENNYRMIVCNIVIEGLVITEFKVSNDFIITPEEAALILAQDEFVSTYHYDGDPKLLEEFETTLTEGAMKTSHKNGFTYLIFNKDNSHVDSLEFRLSNDVHGVFYVSKSGEVIASANTQEGIDALEKDLEESAISPSLEPVSRYQFDSSVLYGYINSDYKEFEDFIESIKR